MVIKTKRLPIQFIKFCLVGVMNTGVDFTVFALLSVWGLPLPATQCLAYSCGIINSFLMNRRWTFNQLGPDISQLFRFFLLNLFTLSVTYGLLAVMHDRLGISLFASKSLVTGVGLVINFVGSRLWVFPQTKTIVVKS
ncbi:MAG: GtrA family protein [Peptococcaceae bacterium]|nr:GtrA family protein [Peptococcaceae bacterium]